jgi:hypothetical protein
MKRKRITSGFNQLNFNILKQKRFQFTILSFILVAFVKAQSPVITSFSPQSGPVGSLVTIVGTDLQMATSLSIGGANAVIVNNTYNDTLVGMVMPGATVGNIVLNTTGGNTTTTNSFTVTPTLCPGVQQGEKLVGTGRVGNSAQGKGVAVSADGNTVIVGAPDDNSNIGAAWIYTRSNGVWSQQGAKLVGSGYTGTVVRQGWAVGISADGNTAIIGGYADNNAKGAFWFFTRTNGVWAQQGTKFVPNDFTGNALIGIAVALSADGNTALIGGGGDNSNFGAAWIFKRTGSNWAQQGNKLVGTGSINASPYQGSAVALSADGNTAAVGGYSDYSNNSANGAVWIYVFNGSSWVQQGNKLIGSGAVCANVAQGRSVALSADGNTLIEGGSSDNCGMGAAWVFTRSGGVWTQEGAKLVGTGNVGTGINFGYSVSISADGNTAAVGGPNDNSNKGAVWYFTRSGGVWSQNAYKLVGTNAVGNNVYQGYALALSATGGTSIIGGYGDANGVGAAWIDTVTSPPIITSISPTSGNPGTLVTIVGSHLDHIDSLKIGGVSAILVNDTTEVFANYGDTIVAMLMPGAVDGPVSVYTIGGSYTYGSFTVTSAPYTNVQQGNKLVGTGFTGAAQQGLSVAVSADGNTAVVGGPNDDNNNGAAWIYTRTGGQWTQQGSKLVGTGATGAASQGTSVAISGDGSKILVGGPWDNNGLGAVWVYARFNGIWSQQGNKLVGSGASGTPNQGNSVSISADGKTAIWGGPNDNSSVGGVWVFTRQGTTWAQQGSKLVGSGATGAAQQGYSVAISADGTTIIAGGINDNIGAGAAWIYLKNGSSWGQQGSKLVGIGAVGKASQGNSVAIASDGNTVLLGGPYDNSNAGATWVFKRTGTSWSQQGSKLVGTGGVGSALQGISVAISADGNTAVLGASNDDNSTGAMWVYTRAGSTWSQQGNKLIGTAAAGTASQGYSVAISAIANTSIVGGNLDDNGNGAAWVFTPCAPTSSSITLAECDSFAWYNTTYTISGVYTHVLTNFNGCDSTITLTLTIDSIDVAVTNNGDGSLTANDSSASYQWVDCNQNYTPVANATNQTYSITQSGNFAVIISKGGCNDTSACVNMTTTGVLSALSAQAISVYPNPANDFLNINVGSQNVVVTLMEITGKLIETKQAEGLIQFNLSGLSSGLYLAKIRTEKESVVVRVVVK